MGKKMTKMMPRYVKDFNLENRIEKYIDSDKKTLSPRYPAAERYYKQNEANAPKIDEFSVNKNVADMARNLEITAKARQLKSDKPLPQSRDPIEQFQYGYKEPKIVPTGKLTIRILDTLINEYKQNKTSEQIDALAAKYSLSKDSVLMLTEFYRPFTGISAISGQGKSNQQQAIAASVFENLRVSSDPSKK